MHWRRLQGFLAPFAWKCSDFKVVGLIKEDHQPADGDEHKGDPRNNFIFQSLVVLDIPGLLAMDLMEAFKGSGHKNFAKPA